jgi:uncharacterized protein (TIGR00299 family) protein
MTKALYLESVAGVAGDMFTASFLDAGLVTHEELSYLVEKLGLDGVTVEIKDVIRATVRAKHLSVKWSDENWKRSFGHSSEHTHASDAGGSNDHDAGNTNILLEDDHEGHWHTHYTDIDRLIASSMLDGQTKDLSRRIFRALAEAEADAHGIAVESVAFHEIGTIDSIMDVVMAAYCITKTGAAEVFATPLRPGRGVVKMRHGTHPIPPPASVRLLTGLAIAQTPPAITCDNIELSTPTGIAIIKCLSPQFTNEVPAGKLLTQGMGAGTLSLGGYPNVFRVALIDAVSPAATLPYERDTVIEIACNIDDDTAEHMAWMTRQLVELGALDVWQTPATGKKGRVLVCLSILVAPDLFNQIADWVLRNSTTFGIRYRHWDRLKLARKFETHDIDGTPVKHKVGLTTAGEVLKQKPEYEDQWGEDPRTGG